MVDLGFLGKVLFCFLAMRSLLGRGQIKFTMLTAIDKRNNMIQVPSLTRSYGTPRDMANPSETLEYPNTHPRRNWSIIGFPYPLRYSPAHFFFLDFQNLAFLVYGRF